MKIAIIGSKNFDNYPKLKRVLDRLRISEIISGGSRGAYELAERYAIENKIPTKIVRSDYERHGASAQMEKNKQIIDRSEMVIAFWDSNTEITKYGIQYAREVGKPLIVETFKNDSRSFFW